MKSKIQSSIKFLKRFFEPASMDVSHTLITIFVIAITIFWNDVLPVVVVPKLLEYIQQGKTAEALQLSIFFCALLFALMAVRYFIRGPFWYSQRKIWGNLELKYRKLILKKDNLYFEKEGTGKVQSIVDNGIGTWAKFFNDMVWYLIESLAIVCVGIYFTSKLGYQFIGLYVVFVILAIALYTPICAPMKYKVDFAHRGIRNDFNARSVSDLSCLGLRSCFLAMLIKSRRPCML
jgi:ABC-type multidrug transport system fused ATPase/permease subunit